MTGITFHLQCNWRYSIVMEWMAKKSKEEVYSRSRVPSFTNEANEMVKGQFQFRTTSDVANTRKILSD